MKKLLKSRKALSPVVAAIILIAVTVAVSIAVAAWMGALTFTFMKTEELRITGIRWDSTNKYVILNCSNTGAGSLTVTSAKFDANSKPIVSTGGSFTSVTDGYALDKGKTGWITINVGSWTSQAKYTVTLVTASGNQYQTSDTAP